ncbi:MAG: Gfo/Idh/MocA family protein [Chloroflexota bacterium]
MVGSPDRTVYRAGIIGCGRIADSIEDEVRDALYWSLLPYSHAGAYQRCDRTQLIAAADPNPERLASFGRRRGVEHLYNDYQEMLAYESLDIVSICAPTRAHADIALGVAQYPVKAIYLEKPIAQSLAEADRMLAAFQAGGITVAVNHIRTYDPIYGRIRRLITEGAIGVPHAIIAHRKEGALFGGTHLFDLLRFLLDAEAEWVFGTLDAGSGRFDPGARGIIGFPAGVQAYVSGAEVSAASAELDIVGTGGRIRVGNERYPELSQLDWSRTRPALVRRGFPGVTDGRSGMLRAVTALVEAIEGGEQPASTAADARRDLEIAVAFHLSHRREATVRLPVKETTYVIADPWGRDG